MQARTPANQANDQHVRVVPIARLRVFFVPSLIETNACHASPRIRNISCRTPAIAAHLASPFPYITHTVLAQAKHDVALDFVQSHSHDFVRFLKIIECWLLCNGTV